MIEPLPERLYDAAIRLWQDSGLTRPWNDPEADLRRAAGGSSSCVLAAIGDGDGLLATAMVGHDGHRGWVYYLAVDPAQRARGLGRQMMEACEDWVRSRGIPKIQLMVRATNRQTGARSASTNIWDTPIQKSSCSGIASIADVCAGQARRTGRDSRPFITLTGRRRSSDGGTASEICGKRARRSGSGNRAGSRLAELVAGRTHSPAGITTSPTGTSWVVNRSFAWFTGLVNRSSSSTAAGSSDGSCRSLVFCPGCVSSARVPEAIRLTVVSKPAMTSRKTVERSSLPVSASAAPPVATLSLAAASADTRSSPGSARLAAISSVK